MILDYALGCAITVVSSYASYRLGRRVRPSAAPTAVCPCGHGINFHKNLTGPCREKVFRRVRDSSALTGASRRQFPCECLNYAGPELISSITMRPVAERKEL